MTANPVPATGGRTPVGHHAVRRIASVWHHHPGVRSGTSLTIGERAADRMRNGMGSWAFVLISLVFLAGWTLGNGRHGFDPYPFILLNLLLSCVAALQGAILLIAAKREDQISSELALHDYQTNLEASQVVHAILDLTQEIHTQFCAPPVEASAVGAGLPVAPAGEIAHG